MDNSANDQTRAAVVAGVLAETREGRSSPTDLFKRVATALCYATTASIMSIPVLDRAVPFLLKSTNLVPDTALTHGSAYLIGACVLAAAVTAGKLGYSIGRDAVSMNRMNGFVKTNLNNG